MPCMQFLIMKSSLFLSCPTISLFFNAVRVLKQKEFVENVMPRCEFYDI